MYHRFLQDETVSTYYSPVSERDLGSCEPFPELECLAAWRIPLLGDLSQTLPTTRDNEIHNPQASSTPTLVLDLEDVLIKVSIFPRELYDATVAYSTPEGFFKYYISYRDGLFDFLEVASTCFTLVL